jgi:hypothetical protein
MCTDDGTLQRESNTPFGAWADLAEYVTVSTTGQVEASVKIITDHN